MGNLIKFTRNTKPAPVQAQPTAMPSSFLTKLRQHQLDETTKTLPVFILFHFCASLVGSILVANFIPSGLLTFWLFAVMLAGAAGLTVLLRWKKIAKTPENISRFIWYMAAAGFSFAACWSMPSLTFVSLTPKDIGFVTYGVTLTVMAMGVITLLRIPFAAIVFITTLVAMLSVSIYQHLPNNKILIAALCLTFGIALNFIVLTIHKSFLSSSKADWKTEEQSKAIALLLNDFEHQTSDWLFETDQHGKLQSFSPSLAEFLEKSQFELIGQNFASYFCDKNDLSNLLGAQKEIANHIVPFHANGADYYWNITAKPRFDENQNFIGFNGVGRNITVQHKAEMQVREAKEEAERASAAKSQFLAVMSHELRTPINAIVGFSEILNTDAGTLSPSHRTEYLETILESSKQLQGLINDILDATRVERGALIIKDQDIDAAELVEAVIKICRDQSNKANISIMAQLVDDVTILGDLTRLKQILVNLLTNALKFSPAQSIIHIDMRKDQSNNLIISVRDAGIGISAEDSERVFEPFVQLEEGSTRRFGGVGLGLSIARRIARMHGGEITLKGEVGMGTDATLTLPAIRITWPKAKANTSTSNAA
jgi:signal transduction histidine kinase